MLLTLQLYITERPSGYERLAADPTSQNDTIDDTIDVRHFS